MRVIRTQKKHIVKAAKVLHSAYFDTIAEAKKDLRESIKNSFVVVEGDEVMGVCTYAPDYTHYAHYLTDIVVAKKHRRKGVANLLLQKFIEVSKKEQPRKQPYAYSSTDVTNKASIKMHLGFGFKKVGIIKKLHYGKDEIFFGYKLR